MTGLIRTINNTIPHKVDLGYRGPKLPGMTIKGGKAFYQGKEITAKEAAKIKKELRVDRLFVRLDKVDI